MVTNFAFQDPEYLYLFLILPLLLLWYSWRDKKGMRSALQYSSLTDIKTIRKKFTIHLRHLPIVLRMIAFSFFIIALARPQLENKKQIVYAEGIDIVLCIDLSTSMLAEDFTPKNRVEAAKSVAVDFINNRTSDKMGLVIFAGKSYSQCPLTLDYNLLKTLIGQLKAGQIEEDGTAIGSAIATAANRLRDSKAKSRVIILLTDGQNNQGEIDPITAAELANSMGIKMYTIGAGTRGYANYPFIDPLFGKRYMKVKVDVDDESLSKIASITGGKYFRATNLKSLQDTYNEINTLEKTKIETETYVEKKEEFLQYLLWGIAFLLIEFIAVNTRFKKFP